MHKIVSFLGIVALAGNILIANVDSAWAAGRRASARRSAYDRVPSNDGMSEAILAPTSADAPTSQESEVVESAEETEPAPDFWFADIHSALELARRENRPLLVHFYTQGCVPCRRMELEVLSTAEIKKTTADYYIPVKIDGSQNPDVVQQFKVKSYPCDFILNPEGKMISRLVGLQTQMTYQTFLTQTAQRMGCQPISLQKNDTEAESVTVQKPAVEEEPEEIAELEPIVEPVVEPEDTLTTPPFVKEAPEVAEISEAPEVSEVVETSEDAEDAEPAPVAQSEEIEVQTDAGIPLLLDGYCPVALVEQKIWVKGNLSYGVRHRGCLYLFASQEAMDRFYAQPDYYALASEGMDVVALANSGEQKPGQRKFGIRYDNINFVFSSAENREAFRENPEVYVTKIRQDILETARARHSEER